MWLALILLPFPMLANAAGFDCAKATSSQEKLICADYRLSDLDEQLASIYKEAIAKTIDKNSFQREQKLWIRARQQCKTFDCVIHAYVTRIEQLALGQKPVHVENLVEEIPWDYVAPKKYEINEAFSRSKNGDYIFEISNKSSLKNDYAWIDYRTRQQLPEDRIESKKLGDLGRSASNDLPGVLGKYFIGADGASYNMCNGDLSDVGLMVSSAKMNKVEPDDASVKKLLALKPGDWTVYRNADFCPEEVLNIEPLSFNFSAVWNDSLYLNDKDFIIRFNHQLQTNSKLVGHKVFIGWSHEIVALIDSESCQKIFLDPKRHATVTEERTCVDKRLQKLIKTIQHFYQ